LDALIVYTNMSQPDELKVSIIIKTLNEEEHIERAVRSALTAVESVGGEVILADSVSTDRTVEIAEQYPITIVQLRNAGDRRCGVGPQLGYQLAAGEYVYILDGDMEMDPEFLPVALKEMELRPVLGGIGGLVDEQSTASYQFRGRKRRKVEATSGDVRWLDMGGLYRRTALDEVGYFSNRNLHAYEEQDLGLRLTSTGWRLSRIPVRSVLHYGYADSSLALLKRRWRSRYLDGGGEVLRAAIGKPYFLEVLLHQKHIMIGLALWLCLFIGVLLAVYTPLVLVATIGAVGLLVLGRALRIGSWRDSIFAQLVWQVTALATVRGFLVRPVDPDTPIDYVICKDARKS
jgi:glycosyltransferase involved in cell wall biosynthesis